MFNDAKTVKTGAKSKKAEKEVVQIDGLEHLAAINALIKSLEGLKKTFESDTKRQMTAHFVVKGRELKKRPENFKGVDGDAAEASCELRARSSASGLSAAEIEELAKFDIPTEEVVDTVDTYVLNPEYKDDQEVLGRVTKLLEGKKGIPADLFMKQEGRSKTVIAKEAMDIVFQLANAEDTKALLPIVGTLAIKSKLTDEQDALEIVRELLEED